MPLRSRAARPAALALSSLAGLGALAACNNDVAAARPQPGFVKVVHAIANAGAVNVLADSTVLATNVAFRAVGPTPNFQYYGVAAGTRQVQVLPAAGGAAAISASLPIASGAYATVIAAGTVGGSGAQAPAFIVLPDSVTTDSINAPPAGRLRLRVVHAATTVGAVDVHAQLVGAGVPRAFSASTRAFANVPFRSVGSAFVAAPTTGFNYDVCVIGAGTTPTPTGSNCAIATSLPAPTTANGLTNAAGGRARAQLTAIAVDPTTAGGAPGLVVTTDKPVQ